MSRKRVIKEEIQEERYLARGLAQDHKLLTGKCAVLSSMSSTIKKKKGERERILNAVSQMKMGSPHI